MPIAEELRKRLSAARVEALGVGDSPLRADRLADKLVEIRRDVDAADADDDVKSRIDSALENADRVLRRDDDGREAARHLEAALRLAEQKPRPPSPFLDD